MDIDGVPVIKQNRILVTRLAEAGLDPNGINQLKIPNLPKSTVYQYYEKWQNNEEFDHRYNSGRPPKLNESDWNLIKTTVKKRKFVNAKSLANIVSNQHQKVVSDRTIQRTLNNHNYEHKEPKVIPFLTPEHKAARVVWAQKHLKDTWDKTIFTDEASFWLDENHVKRWMPAEEVYYNAQRKYPPKLQVWAGISKKGVFGPIIFKENMNGELYTDILNYVWSDIYDKFKFTTNWRFQKDNDSKHTCFLADYFFVKHRVRLLDWVSNSPDLNPIENFWAMVKREVEIMNPRTLDQLEDCIEEAFEKIRFSAVCSLVDSMPNRLKQCIERNGEKTDY